MDYEFNNQQGMGEYQDPLASAVQTTEVKPDKKKGKGAGLLSVVGSVILFRLFGVIGGAICIGGFAVVTAIIKSKMPTVAKVLLSIVTIIGFLVLLFVFIMFSAAVIAQ